MSDWFGCARPHRRSTPGSTCRDRRAIGAQSDRGGRSGEVEAATVRRSALNVLRLDAADGALRPGRTAARRDRPRTGAGSRAGAEGAVLQRTTALPLAKGPMGRIAVIGPNARTAHHGRRLRSSKPHYRVSPWDGLVARSAATTAWSTPSAAATTVSSRCSRPR